jgi:hypothetical protein
MTRSNTVSITVEASLPFDPDTIINSITDSLSWNGQTITCTGPYRTVTVTILDMVRIIHNAVDGHEGNVSVGYYIAQHPFMDGLYWTVVG